MTDRMPDVAELRERLINIEDKINHLMDRGGQSAALMPDVITRPNVALGSCARNIYTLLRPRDVIQARLARKGRDFDGGYVMLDQGLKDVVAYSLGISDDVSWDFEMAALGCHVFQYDHTIDRPPATHANFHFEKLGIAEQASGDGMMTTLEDLMTRNGHADDRNLILKMDIEGSEWKVLELVPERILNNISQLIVEFHGLIHVDQTYHYRRIAKVLRKLDKNHQSIHVHANNYGSAAMLGGVLLPDTLEVTYVRRADHSFAECRKVFPTELDMPCNHAAPDYFLGALGLL